MGLTPDPSSRSPTEPEAGFQVRPAETSVIEGKVVGVRDGLELDVIADKADEVSVGTLLN